MLATSSGPVEPDAQMSKKDAIDAAAILLQDVFPDANGDLRCIKARLEACYNKRNCTPCNASGANGSVDTAAATNR